MIDPARADESMTAFIDAILGESEDLIPSIAAAGLVADLRSSDPELLAVWLDAHAEAFLREAIGTVIRSRRARSRNKASAGVFARAARVFEQTGDRNVLSPFEQRYVVDGADTQRRVRDMTRTDCLFVAERYEITANRGAMLAAFHSAVARRVGDKTVGQVYTEAEYDRLYRSITGQATATG